MSSSLGRVSAATVAFWTTTAVSIASLGALCALTISLASNNTASGTQIHTVTLAAGVLEIIALLCVVLAASLFLLRTTRNVQVWCCGSFATIAIAAAVITIYALAQLWNAGGSEDSVDSENHNTGTALTQAGFAIWAIATFSEVLLYSVIFWPYTRHDSDLPASELAARLQQVQSKRSTSVRLASLSSPRSSPHHHEVTDPTLSRFSSPSLSPRSSFRRSVSQTFRPMTSKTRLLLRSSIISRETASVHTPREPSIESPRLQNEFRDWDTSGAMGHEDQQSLDNFVSTRTRRTQLEPIPGSRPVSPAKPLDGPFGHASGTEPPLPDSPMTSPALSQSEVGSPSLVRPRAVSRPHSNHSSSQEAHIHPLFRSESPNPPPIASPGTVITGQQGEFPAPPPRLLRSGSRPASPSPLAQSRQGSLRSLRAQPQQTSPVEVRSPSVLSWGSGKEG